MANMIMFSICRYQLSNDDGNKGQQETNSQKVRLECALHFFYLWGSLIEEMVMMIMTKSNKQIISAQSRNNKETPILVIIPIGAPG